MASSHLKCTSRSTQGRRNLLPSLSLEKERTDPAVIQQHSQPPMPSRGRPPKNLDVRGRVDRKLSSKAGQAIGGLCKTIVEPVLSQIKGCLGLDRFRLRGLGERWTLPTLWASTTAVLPVDGVGDGCRPCAGGGGQQTGPCNTFRRSFARHLLEHREPTSERFSNLSA